MKVSNTKGPISDALTKATRAIKDGTIIGSAGVQFIQAVLRANGPDDEGSDAGRCAATGDGLTQADAQREAEVSAGPRSGTKNGGSTEITEAGDQSVMSGFEKAPDKDVAQVELAKPLFGGNAPTQEGGFFDEGARNQGDLFEPSKTGPDAPKKAGDTGGDAHNN